MTNDSIKNKLEQGYKLELWLKPTKKYDKLTFKTMLIKREDSKNLVYFLNYHHAKKFLTAEQIRIKNIYDQVKNIQFNELVNLNVKSQKLELTREETEILVMYKSIKKIESIEFI